MSLFKMKKIVLQSLFKKPATIEYPIKPAPKTERTRGQIEIDLDSCIFCGMCTRKCPTNAIDVSKSDKSWEIARFGCIQCGACVEACPKKCLRMTNIQTTASHKKVISKFVTDMQACSNQACSNQASSTQASSIHNTANNPNG